jgi:Zn-finger nucleic acid-binding protein
VAKSASSEIEPQVSDSIKSKRCPECNKNLYRSLVGHGTKISIERCETCRGYWFDKNEWELLESRDIVGEIHKIFSSDWQKQARLEEIAARKEQQLKTEIGGEHFRKVDEFRKWLNGFEKKEAVWAFLNYQR